ncbi:MAG: competence/damage-inducible protein A [Bacteroidales bacterium]|nr:competence/damage-inducible protein A [Bacteroidales bacterium]
MKAAIITIGDELLIGQTVDTNSAWMGAELSKAGFDVYRMTSIHDRRDDIIYALNEAAGKTDVVLITGGLGPTSDDITKQTLCEFFNTKLVMNTEVLKMIEDMLARRNFPMNENNRRQAEVPESCLVIKNAAGTAPGMWFEKDGTIYISMPGVPYEMKYIMQEHVLPELRKRFTSQIIIHRNIMTYGTAEAKLAEILTEFEAALPAAVKLAYLPAWGIIKLRLTATGEEQSVIEKILEEQVKKLFKVIPEFIYAENEETMEMVIGRLLNEKNKTLCTVESCTGGEIAHMITSVPGSSAYYKGSVVAYSNSVKTQLLGIKEDTIKQHGAVSEETVIEMAIAARKLLNTDFAVATSGIAGPEGGTESKPVGTLWIAVASEKGTVTEKRILGNDRISNIKRFSLAAMNLLRKQIVNY